MTHSTTLNINGMRYVQAKEVEVNFWVAFFGIAVGVLLGILLLRTLFTVTLAEQSLIDNSPQTKQIMLERPSDITIPSNDVSV